MNIFESGAIKLYADKWEVVSTRKFTEEEINYILTAIVVASQFGNSIKFTLKRGGCMFIPLDPNSTVGVGTIVNMEDVTLVELHKEGELNITRAFV